MNAHADARVPGSPWPVGVRLLVAAPGLLVALPLLAYGAYLIATSIPGISQPDMAADEEFASIVALGLLLGLGAVAVGLYLLLAAAAVSGKYPGTLRLALAAAVVVSGSSVVGYLLASGADAMPYAPVLAVQLYLATVAMLRLISLRRRGA